MPYVHDGTEEFDGGTAYWLRDDETGERIPVQDPLTAQEFAGPFASLAGATAPDRRTAETRISLDPMAGMADTAAPTPGLETTPASLPENVTGALAAAAPKPMNATEQDTYDKRTGKTKPWGGAQADDDGLVYLTNDQGGAPTGPGAPSAQQGPEYFSPTPTKMPGLDVDPRQFVRGPTKAGWVAASKKEKGDPETIEDIRNRAGQLLESQIATAEAERTARQNIATQRLAESELAQTRNLAEQGRLRVEADQKEKEKRRRLTDIDREAQQVAGRQVDPNRWYTNAGPGGVIMAALARGAGVFAGTDEPGKIIDSFIAADIEQQEEEYRSAAGKLDETRNAFAREMADGADPEIARKKIELMQNEYAVSVLADRELIETLQMLGVDTEKIKQERAEKSLNLRTQIESLVGGDVDSRFRTASGGGFDQMGYLQAREQAAKTSQAEGEAYGVFPTQAERLETQKQRAAQNPNSKEFRDEVRAVGDTLGKGEGVTMADLYVSKEKLLTTIQQLAADNEGNIPGRGWIEGNLPSLLSGPQGREIRREAERFADLSLKRISGAASPDAEVQKQLEQAIAVYQNLDASDEEIADAMMSTADLVDNQVAIRTASFSKPAVDQFFQNYGERRSDMRQRAAQRGDLRGADSTFKED